MIFAQICDDSRGEVYLLTAVSSYIYSNKLHININVCFKYILWMSITTTINILKNKVKDYDIVEAEETKKF